MKKSSLSLKPRFCNSRCCHMLFPNKKNIAVRCFYEGFPDESLQADQMIYRSSLFTESCLRLVIRLSDSWYQSFVNHSLSSCKGSDPNRWVDSSVD